MANAFPTEIARIRLLLDEASLFADHLAQHETGANAPFSLLSQAIDTALARAENLAEQAAA